MEKRVKKPLRILAAEDDAQEAFLLKRAFLKAGINVPLDFVADGQEAIDWLEGQGPFNDRERHPLPTLLLLDLKMPRIDGFEVIQWLRNKPDFRRLVVVVLTNSSLPKDINRAYDLGANSYLRKPTDLNNLQEIVEQVERYWLVTNEMPEIVVSAATLAPRAAIT